MTNRSGSVVVSFQGDSKIGTLTVEDEVWGAVEWSEKRGQWCIEDVEGQCLRHTASIHGQAASREEAIALAEQLVRDGTMPTPQDARRQHQERLQRQREQRAQQPGEIRRKEAQAKALAEDRRLSRARWDAESAEREAPPFYEIFAEAFDLADPQLWKSNSFALLRPRLILEARAVITALESNISRNSRGRRSPWPEDELKLARAREILALIDDGSVPQGGDE